LRWFQRRKKLISSLHDKTEPKEGARRFRGTGRAKKKEKELSETSWTSNVKSFSAHLLLTTKVGFKI
jgi:hypothetical protein